MQTMRTQLAVIGGGPAGVCAAIAAARHGIQTMLVTDRPVLGGNSSSEIRVWTRGATGAGNLWAEEMCVWGELKLENLYRNSDANPVFWDETLLDAVQREKNLTLLLNTEIYEVELDGGRVAALRGVQQSSERQFHIEADYFIDATGDGTVSAKAGVPFSVGNGNHETLGNSILYYTRREDHPVSFIAPDYAYDMSHIEKILGCGGRIINERMSGSDFFERRRLYHVPGSARQAYPDRDARRTGDDASRTLRKCKAAKSAEYWYANNAAAMGASTGHPDDRGGNYRR